MKKIILSIFAAASLLVGCEKEQPVKLYRVISTDKDTIFVEAFRWRIYGDSKPYIIFDCGDRFYPVHCYVTDVKSIVPMEDNE
jgi:hypothetical protein